MIKLLSKYRMLTCFPLEKGLLKTTTVQNMLKKGVGRVFVGVPGTLSADIAYYYPICHQGTGLKLICKGAPMVDDPNNYVLNRIDELEGELPDFTG